jgi:hypothetical protein
MSAKLKDDISTFITGFALLAIIYMLVRPGMPANQAVKDVSDALVAMTRLATGWSATQNGSGGVQNV